MPWMVAVTVIVNMIRWRHYQRVIQMAREGVMVVGIVMNRSIVSHPMVVMIIVRIGTMVIIVVMHPKQRIAMVIQAVVMMAHCDGRSCQQSIQGRACC